MSCKNINFKFSIEDDYENIIISQNSDGMWTKGSVDVDSFITKYSKEFEKIKLNFENLIKKGSSINIKNIYTIEDYILTVFIIYIIETDYTNKYNEHKLILNKAKKKLKNDGYDINC